VTELNLDFDEEMAADAKEFGIQQQTFIDAFITPRIRKEYAISTPSPEAYENGTERFGVKELIGLAKDVCVDPLFDDWCESFLAEGALPSRELYEHLYRRRHVWNVGKERRVRDAREYYATCCALMALHVARGQSSSWVERLLYYAEQSKVKGEDVL